MCRKRFVFILFIFFMLETFADSLFSYKYTKDERFFVNDEYVLNPDLISIDEASVLTVYSAEQIFYFVKNWTSKLEKMDEKNGDYHCYYNPDEIVQVDNMTLTRALFFRAKDNWFLPGFVIYINLDDQYRKKHTYVSSYNISTVFDQNGNAFLLEDRNEKITFYKLNNLEMESGAVYSYRPYCINFINAKTRQVMYYKIESGETSPIQNMPSFDNPKLCYGENLKEVTAENLKLKHIEKDMKIIPNGIVYRNERVMRGYDGTHIFDTIYLLDFTSDGTRKKGVYKIMGDRFEFYPDL